MKNSFFIVLLAVVLYSCGNGDVKNEQETKDTLAKVDTAKKDNSQLGLKKQIKELEDSLYKSEVLDKDLGRRAIAMYQNYYNYYWTDTMAADYLFKAAEIADNMGYPQKAIELYNNCYSTYPRSYTAPMSLFRMGNIYQFTLSDYVEAKYQYLTIVREYPKSAIAKDAQTLIDNSNNQCTDEQMIRDFEKKNGIKKEKETAEK